MNFDPLSFVIGKHGDSGPVRDVVSYLIGRVAGTAGEIWQTLTNVAVASFTAVSTILRELVIDVTPIQSGSGDPSPTNIRTISGWTGANIVRSARNLLNPATSESVNAYYDTTNNVFVEYATGRSVWFFLPAGTYTASAYITTQYQRFVAVSFPHKPTLASTDGTVVFRANDTQSPVATFTLASDAWISLFYQNGGTASITDCQVQVERGSEKTDYDPGTTYPVSWETEVGTVYGGTLTDNGNGTWTLSVTHDIIDLGELSWSKNAIYANKFFYTPLPEWAKAYTTIVSAQVNSKSKTLCECYGHYEPVGGSYNYYENIQDNTYIVAAAGQSSANRVYIRNDVYKDSTSAAFKTAMEGQHIVLERATPQVYTLTADSVQALIGQNNIFADTGNINTITFRTH